MTAFPTDRLAELARKKLECLLELHKMGEKQLELVREDRITDLLDLLSAKQRLLLALGRVEKQLEPFRGQAPEQRRWRACETRRACAQDLEQCEKLLVQIIAREKQSEKELTRRRDEVAARLQVVHQASRARGAYTAQSPPYISQLDLSSESRPPSMNDK